MLSRAYIIVAATYFVSATFARAGHAIVRRDTNTTIDGLGDSLPTICLTPCNAVLNGLVTGAVAAAQSDSPDVNQVYASICTDSFAINFASCVSCMETNANAATDTTGFNSTALDGYNTVCIGLAQSEKKTWTNVTTTQSGGFDGKGKSIGTNGVVGSGAVGLGVSLGAGLIGVIVGVIALV